MQKPESEKVFVPLNELWVVERRYGWVNFKRRLSHDFEKTIESMEAMLRLGFIDILLKKQPNNISKHSLKHLTI